MIESLKQIASAEFQEKGWVKGEIHDFCCYNETLWGLFLEGLFDELIDVEAKKFGFSEDQIKKLDRLRQALHTFDSRYSGLEDPKIIISDPEWLQIRELARDALKSFGIEKYLDPSKGIFKESLLRRIYWISDSAIQKGWCMQEKSNRQPLKELMDDIFKSFKFAEIINHYKEYEIAENQILSLRKLYNALKIYREKTEGVQDLKRIIEDPEWHQIQALAKEVIQVFEYKP